MLGFPHFILIFLRFFGILTKPEITASNENYRMPEWLTIGGTYRIRHELQEGWFREGRTGDDQALVERLFLNARGELGSFYLGGELEDARANLDNRGTPVGTDDVQEHIYLRVHYSKTDQTLLEPPILCMSISRQL